MASNAGTQMSRLGFAIKDQAVNAFRGLIDIAKKAGVALSAFGTIATGMGINTASQLETAQIGMETLLGSTEEAQKAMQRIKKEASRTPFEIAGLTQAVQLLTSVTKDGDKAIDTILDIGEGLASMGKGQAELDRIIINLQQIGSVGHASMLDIKQFAFAGLPIFEMLSEETGKFGEELSTAISNGDITFEVLTNAFDKANDSGGRFFNAYANQAGSFEQMTSNMKDSFNIFMADFVTQTGLFDLMKKSMAGVTSFISDNQELIVGIGIAIGDGFKWAFDQISSFGTWIQTNMPGTIQLFKDMGDMMYNQMVVGIKDEIMPLLPQLKEEFRQLFLAVENFYVNNREEIMALTSMTIPALIFAIKGIIGAVKLIVGGVKNLINFVNGLMNAFRRVRDVINDISNKIGEISRKAGGSANLARSFAGGLGGGIFGKRASGGPVMANKTYLVGEQGPELFVPNTAGEIKNNTETKKIYNENSNITINQYGNNLNTHFIPSYGF